MLAFAMQWIQHVVFEFDAQVRSFAVTKLHASNFAPFAARRSVTTVKKNDPPGM
jgi:hypothetical protein